MCFHVVTVNIPHSEDNKGPFHRHHIYPFYGPMESSNTQLTKEMSRKSP